MIAYRCPGINEGEPGTAMRTVHADGCCAQFALMSPQHRAQIGLRLHLPGHEVREELPRPPAVTTLSVPQAARLVADLQRRAAEHPDEEPPGATAWVEYGPSHTEADLQALKDLGQPYNLVLGYRRVPHDPEGAVT